MLDKEKQIHLSDTVLLVKHPRIASRIKVDLDFQVLSATMNIIISITIARNQTLTIREDGYDSELTECDK